MFENNGFTFDSAGSFFGESTTPSFENGFSNAGPSDGFFGESAFDENGFSTPETSAFGESASYGGGFTQFGSAFCESAFGEDGFSADDMFCEGDNSIDSDKKGDWFDKHKGENVVGLNKDTQRGAVKRYNDLVKAEAAAKKSPDDPSAKKKLTAARERIDEVEREGRRHETIGDTSDYHNWRIKKSGNNTKKKD